MNNAILILPFLLGLAPGIYLAREGKPISLAAFLIVVAGVTVWAMLDGQGGEGVSATLSLFIVRMLSPVVIGLAVGGVIGLYLVRKAGHISADDQNRAADPV